MTEFIDTTVYLQVRRDERNTWSRKGTVVRHTAKKPDPPVAGAVVVKVTVRVPKAAFEPLQPEAVVEVPASLVQQPVEVVAEDADS